MRTFRSAFVVVAILVLGACSGEGEAAPDDGDTSPGRGQGPVEAAATPPDGLALAETEIDVTGDEGVLVTPGEEVTVFHLVNNDAPTARSLGFRVQSEVEGMEVDLSVRSIRVAPSEILTFESSVQVPRGAQVGDVLEYEVVVVNVDDINERGASTVRLLVVDAEGARPVAGADAGTTTTNERVISYVVRDDADADGDLDLHSLRVIAGGFLAAELTSGSTGSITYVPYANVTGRDVVLYEICDAEERCATAPLTILIEES